MKQQSKTNAQGAGNRNAQVSAMRCSEAFHDTHLLKKQHGFRKFEISNPVQTLCLSLASVARASQALWIATQHQHTRSVFDKASSGGKALTLSMAKAGTTCKFHLAGCVHYTSDPAALCLVSAMLCRRQDEICSACYRPFCHAHRGKVSSTQSI